MFSSNQNNVRGDHLEMLKNQTETIALIKKLFSEMCSSRRSLKPILTEIVKALDDNLFVDADSSEVKDLLEHIVQMQARLSEFDGLRSVAGTKNVGKLENAITDLDNKNAVNEMKEILLRFKNLTYKSNDPNVADDAKKLQLQANKLYVQADKNDFNKFIIDGKKFSDLADMIDDPSKVSPTSCAQIQSMFPDLKFFVYALMQKQFSLSKEEEEKPKPSEHPNELDAFESKLKTLGKLLKPCTEGINQLIMSEADFNIETAEVKKVLTSKSFNNKLGSLIDRNKSDFMPVLKNFCNGRVFSFDNAGLKNEFGGYNYSPMVPTVSERFFQWGAVYKVHWGELSFYYLNDYGYELLCKFLQLKDGKALHKKIAAQGMLQYIRRFVFLSLFSRLDVDKKEYETDGNPFHFWIRTKLQCDDKLSVYMAMSLMMLDADWNKHIFSFLASVNEEVKIGNDLRGVFLLTTLDVKMLAPWFKLFKKINAQNLFAVILDGKAVKYCDIDGDTVSFDDMIDYLHGNEFDTFADYKNKYIKKTRRSRKKASETSAAVEAEKTEAVEKGKRTVKTKKTEKASSPKKSSSAKESAIDDDSEPIIPLFNAPQTYDFDISQYRTDEDTVDEEKMPVEEPAEEIAPEENISVESEVEKVEPEIADDDAQQPTLFSMASIELDEPLTVDEDFLKGIIKNAGVLFLKGSAARGMLELHILRLRNDLQSVANEKFSEQMLDRLDWLDGLTKLTADALDDPFMRSTLKDFMPLEFCDGFFARAVPFEDIDVDYLKNFFMATFLIKNSYAPDMNAVYELSARQSQFLSDKSNAALKLCPSIKKLITLFKDFTERRNVPFASALHTDYDGVNKQFESALGLMEKADGRASLTLRGSDKHPRVNILSKQLYDTDGVIRRKTNLQDADPIELTEFCRQFLNKDVSFEDERLKISDDIFSKQKVAAYLDEVWDKIKVDMHKGEKFKGGERTRHINALTEILTALATYAIAKKKLDAIGDGSPVPIENALSLIDGIIDEVRSVVKEFNLNHIGPTMLSIYLQQLKALIEEKTPTPFYRECLLGARYIELSPKGLPETDNIGALRYSFAYRVPEYENALGNQNLDEAVRTACETAVGAYDLGVFEQLEENYRAQLNLSDEKIKQIRAARNQVGRRLEILHREFLRKIELDRHYARLSNPGDIDYYVMAVETAKHHFDESGNAGLFERFIKAINVGIAKNAKADAANLLERSESIADGAVRLSVTHLIEDGRNNVAEDYINEGGVCVDISFDGGLDEFLAVYESIFSVCVKNKNESLEKILSGLKRDLNDVQLREFAETWQNISSKTSAIPILLRHLSFNCEEVDPLRKQSNNQLEFHAKFAEEADGLPFDIFSALANSEGLDFVYMPYAMKFDELIEALLKLERRGSTVCLLNMALSLGDRRKLAQSLKLRAELKNIIVIDRVLAVYLTAFEQSERRKKLLGATLPFANVNPYVEDSTEIFIGRERELETLSDINGATFLVGGRQLGKTALLNQLIKLRHKPSEGIFILKAIGEDWEAIRADMLKRLKSDEVKQLILLIDINKTFASLKGTELEMFARLREEFAGRFKFIVTAHHTSATNDNAVRLKPFTPKEAARLTAEPLSVMGLKIKNESVLRSIWVRANYYPGLLKYYCGKMVEALADNYELKNFYATKNPPYNFDDEFLQNLLQRHELHDELNRRLIETLHDAQDEYYYLLMLAMAYSAFAEKSKPINLEQIRDTFGYHDIDDLYNSNEELLELLLEEMCELKLIRQEGEQYKFYRSAFRYLFGYNDKQIEKRLKECAQRHKMRAEQ